MPQQFACMEKGAERCFSEMLDPCLLQFHCTGCNDLRSAASVRECKLVKHQACCPHARAPVLRWGLIFCDQPFAHAFQTGLLLSRKAAMSDCKTGVK